MMAWLVWVLKSTIAYHMDRMNLPEAAATSMV